MWPKRCNTGVWIADGVPYSESMILRTLLLLTPSLMLAASPEEMAAARVPLENYLRGHATGKAEFMKLAFHPGAHVQGFRADGKFIDWPVEEYIALFKGEVSPEEPRRKRTIMMVDVTGEAAVAKIDFDYPASNITDYFLLLKKNGEWRIANKIFQGSAKR